MSIREIHQNDIHYLLTLWNNSINHKEMLYQILDEKTFLSKFFISDLNVEIKTYVHINDKHLEGFLSGVIDENKQKAYITTVLIDFSYRRKGIASSLLKEFEHHVHSNHPSIQSIDIVFFNPIQLEWIVPNTAHIHPNAPGVDYESPAYYFFKHHGYITFAKQNSYYKNVLNYTYSDNIQKAFDHLKENLISITFYNQNKHRGLDDLFADLNNPNWKDEITNALLCHDPVLIAETNGKIIGFTGPLKVQSNLRGYFAGIGVHSDYRDFGVGKVLFSSLCMELKNIGAHYMTLFTGESNPARYIYEKEGFEMVRSWANMRISRK